MTMDERHAAVARRIVRECAGVRAGENVYIEGRGDSLEYLELLAFECELVGALPLVVAQSDEARRRRLMELNAGQLGATSRSWIEAVKAADVVFTMHCEDGDPRLFADVPTSQRGAEGRGRKLLDEKILGTIHIAVGDNTMLGGVNDSSLHWDLLVLNPTVTVDGRTLLGGGELAV